MSIDGSVRSKSSVPFQPFGASANSGGPLSGSLLMVLVIGSAEKPVRAGKVTTFCEVLSKIVTATS
jgi:hypothetical protein